MIFQLPKKGEVEDRQQPKQQAEEKKQRTNKLKKKSKGCSMLIMNRE